LGRAEHPARQSTRHVLKKERRRGVCLRPPEIANSERILNVADAVPGARVVKAFNTLFAVLLGADPAVPGGRRVLFVSGDDASARTAVVDLIERLGFAAVDLGGLAEGGRAQQFGGGASGKEFVQIG